MCVYTSILGLGEYTIQDKTSSMDEGLTKAQISQIQEHGEVLCLMFTLTGWASILGET